MQAVVARPGVDGHADHAQAGAEAEVGRLVGEARHEADEQEQQARVRDEARDQAAQQARALGGGHCNRCNCDGIEARKCKVILVEGQRMCWYIQHVTQTESEPRDKSHGTRGPVRFQHNRGRLI